MSTPVMAEQIAKVAVESQRQRTGLQPKSVNVVVSGDTLVITLQGGLSPAEQLLSRSPDGAAKVMEFHRQLFHSSADLLRTQIERITGTELRDSDETVEPTRGPVFQIFATGTVVQVFLFKHSLPTQAWSGNAIGDLAQSNDLTTFTSPQ